MQTDHRGARFRVNVVERRRDVRVQGLGASDAPRRRGAAAARASSASARGVQIPDGHARVRRLRARGIGVRAPEKRRRHRAPGRELANLPFVVAFASAVASVVPLDRARPRELDDASEQHRARAGDGATEAGAAREREERRRASTRRWLDFVHSKAFRDEVSDVFARASAVHRDDGVMDCTELQFAIDLLHERLREKGANGHAMPRGPRAGRREARELLRDFDLDRDGALDEREFHLLCQRYFSRLEWPMWRVFTRGATIGLALYAAHELWISPLAQNVYWNHFYPKIVQRLKKRYQKRYAGRVNTFLKKFRRPPKKEELLELERIAQEELKKKRIRRIKAAASASVIGGTTSALGIL